MSGIYVHIPFCKTRCIYCDFYSTTLGSSRSKLYIDRLLAEIDERHDFLPIESDPLRTIYLGGGTPSQLPFEETIRLINGLLARFPEQPIEEITLEANPDDVDRLCTEARQIAGNGSAIENLFAPINRVSMGVQSFVDSELKTLCRRHDSLTVLNAIAKLREIGIQNISIDLMYGLPGQTLESFERSIDEALRQNVQHISAYNLTVEEGTRLSQAIEEGQLQVADDELCNAMNEMLRHKLLEAGFLQYEISNYALPGFHSRHNSSYWTGDAYLGLGPGAHSYDGRKLRSWNEPDLPAYLEGHRTESCEVLTDTDLYNERIMLGLRTLQGIPDSSVHHDATFQSLLDRGLLERTPSHHIHLTDTGLPLADQVIRDLFL